MIPRRYYIAPMAAFQSLRGVEWHAVSIGQANLHLGHVDFSGDPQRQTQFEQVVGVTPLGTLFHGTIPAAVATLLQAQGVTTADTAFAAIEKVIGKLGGLTLHV